jgi:outer membrane immunogenic protein
MTKFLLAGAAALAFMAATPAVAQTVPYAQVNTGISDTNISNTRVDYGATVGVDAFVADRTFVGVDANATNVFRNNGRTLGAGARLGYAVSPNAAVYARVGYANLDTAFKDLNGYTLGGGINFNVAPHTYINTEYRYTNYEQGVHSNAGLLGLGVRF